MRKLIYTLVIIIILFHSDSFGQNMLFNSSDYLEEPYGCTAHIAFNNDKYGDYSCKDSLVLLAKKVGMTYIRFDFDPRCIDVWDTVVNSINKAELKPYIVLTSYHFDRKHLPWIDFVNYSRYLNASVIKYGNDITVWEIMNEVDLIYDNADKIRKEIKLTTIGYTKILLKVVSFIRKYSANSIISMGSVCRFESHFLNKLFNDRLFDYTDILNIHIYSEPEKMVDKLYMIKSKMDKSNIRTNVWLTECGMPTNIDKSIPITKEEMEIEQARRVARIHLLSFAYGVEKVFWYNLRSLENDPYDKESHFGLLHRNLSPKPSYYAYKTMTTMCPNGSSRPKLLIKDGIYMCYWVRPDNKRIWAVWSIKELTMSKLKLKRVSTFYDYMGSKCKKPQNINNGVLYMVGDSRTMVYL